MGKALVPILVIAYLVVAAVLWAVGLLLGADPIHLVAYSLLALIPPALVYGVLRVLALRREKAFEAKIAEQGKAAGGGELQIQFQKGLKLIRESAYNRSALTTLPWYLIIGAPGSGKSTAIRESGLTFPSVGQGLRSFRGIGGTRNCDWWITDEAFFLDTAGRYTTRPDDRQEWFAFLDMVKRHRRQVPLNGVLVTVSALDLIKKDEAAMEAHAQIVRDRIEEVATRLELRLPVYLLFTKCDLISGFKNFFADLSRGEKDQVFGATLPWPPEAGADEAQRFRDELESLKPGLTTHRMRIVGRAMDADATGALKSVRFPSQLARVQGFMEHFIGAVFRAGRIRDCAGLRGFYFTSGTQPGAEGEQPAAPAAKAAEAPAPAPAPAPTPAFEGSIFIAPSGGAGAGIASSDPEDRSSGIFLRNLFAKVVIPDAGLVRRSLARIRRQRLLAMGCRIGCPVLGLLLMIAITVDYGGSLGLVGEAETLIERMRDDRQAGLEALPLRVQRLDQLRALMERIERDDPPGVGSLRADLAVVYYRHLGEIILRPLATGLAAELAAPEDDSESGRDLRRLYELYLAYRSLGGELPADAGGPETVARTLRQDQRWIAPLGQADGETQRLAERQLDYLMTHPADAAVWAVTLDRSLLERLQVQLADSLLIQQGYDQVLSSLAGARPLIGRDTLVTGSYRDHLVNDQKVPGIFTHDAWHGVVKARLESESEQLERRFQELGKPMAQAAIMQRLTALFRNDHDRAWLEFIRSTRVAPSSTLRESGKKLGVITGLQSPWRELLRESWRQAAFAFDDGLVDDELEQSLAWFEGVTAQLAQLDQAVQRFEGATDFGRRSDDLQRVEELVRGIEDGRLAIAGALRQIANQRLQAAVRASCEAVLASVFEALGAEVAAEQNDRWRQQVQAPFAADFAARYPFAPTAETEVPLAVFGGMFAPETGSISSRIAAIETLHAIKALDRSLLEVERDYEHCAKRVATIHAALFAAGGDMPRLDFAATLQQRQGVKDMALTVCGKRFSLYDAPTPRSDFSWGADGEPGAKIAISIPGDHWLQLADNGAWGLFRLFDRAAIERQSAGGWDLTWTFESDAMGEDVRFRAGARLSGGPLDPLLDQRDLFSAFVCPQRVAP